jgi:hypothetical protein
MSPANVRQQRNTVRKSHFLETTIEITLSPTFSEHDHIQSTYLLILYTHFIVSNVPGNTTEDHYTKVLSQHCSKYLHTDF